MAYTTINDPSAHFQVTNYTGNGSTQTITFNGNSNLQPDWVWLKDRDNPNSHRLVNSIRGSTKYLISSVDKEWLPLNELITTHPIASVKLSCHSNTISGAFDSYFSNKDFIKKI